MKSIDYKIAEKYSKEIDWLNQKYHTVERIAQMIGESEWDTLNALLKDPKIKVEIHRDRVIARKTEALNEK